MKFIPPAVQLALYCACIFPVTGKLRGGGNGMGKGKGKGIGKGPSNPQDYQPSLVFTEDGDYHASDEDDCSITAIELLMIPSEEGGHGRALKGDTGLEFACVFPDQR